MSDNTLGIAIILGIISIAAFGGVKNSQNSGFLSPQPLTQEQKQANIERQIQESQTQIDNLKKQIQLEESNNENKLG